MSHSRISAVTTVLASLALALSAGAAFADRPDHGHGNGHRNGHGKKHDDDRPVVVVQAPRPVIVVRAPRPQPPVQIVIGRALPRNSYHVLDPDLYYRTYGSRMDDRYSYAEAYDGTRILVDIASGVIARILTDALAPQPARPMVAQGGLAIPPGHLPPPGLCRVWYPDLPPGHQPAAGSCNVRVPRGAVLIGG